MRVILKEGGKLMFWRKKGGKEKEKEKEKGAQPIPGSVVWMYMHGELGITGEELMNLNRVESDGTAGNKPATLVRIFDPATANKKGVAIDSYESLDNHPELVLYEGYYRGTGREVTDIHIEKK